MIKTLTGIERRRKLKRFLTFLAVCILLLLFSLPHALGETKQLKITFLGDCTVGGEDRLREKDYSFDAYLKQKGYAYFFKKVKSIIGKDDLTVANLEGVLFDSDWGKVKKTYNFRGLTKYTKVLTAGSVECVNVANNHTMDYGVSGLKSTVSALSKAGVAWYGCNDVYRKTWVFQKNGIKIGFLGMEISYWVRNEDIIEKKVKLLRDEGCQVVVGAYHGGSEYYRKHNGSQEKIAHAMVDAGCNLVIGHHPHVLQGIEVYKNATICYSLGNFMFGGNAQFKRGRALYTALFQFAFSFDENNKYLGQRLTIYPAYTSGHTDYNDYQPRLVTGKEAKKVMKTIQDDTSFKLKAYVKGKGAVQNYVPAAQK